MFARIPSRLPLIALAAVLGLSVVALRPGVAAGAEIETCGANSICVSIADATSMATTIGQNGSVAVAAAGSQSQAISSANNGSVAVSGASYQSAALAIGG